VSRHDRARLDDIAAALGAIDAHRYFDTSHAVVAHTVDHDLPVLSSAVERLRRG